MKYCLLNEIYKKDVLPEDFEEVNFVPVSKRNYSQMNAEYRTIALKNHSLKLLLFTENAR